MGLCQVNKTNVGGKTYSGEATSDSQKGSSLSSGFPRNYGSVPSGSTDSMSPTSTLTSLCEDADSGKSVSYVMVVALNPFNSHAKALHWFTVTPYIYTSVWSIWSKWFNQTSS